MAERQLNRETVSSGMVILTPAERVLNLVCGAQQAAIPVPSLCGASDPPAC